MAWRKKYVEEGISHTAANLAQMVDWMAKARLNVLNCPIDYQHHGRVRWDNWREALIPELRKRGLLIEVGGHGYPNFLPVGKYFDAHPEWFGMVGGRRTRAENVVFSTANTDAVNAYIANVTDYLKQRPEIDIFDAWPPDGARWSEAPEDVALGKPAERHALLVKQLAGALAGSLPRVRLQFIAYATYLEPPASTRFPANVLMEYCPINRSFESPLFDSASAVNTQYFGHLTEWLKRTIDPSQVTLYSYITKYGWRSLPILIPRMIASEVRRFAEMGIGGLATYSEPGAWATFEIDHYMAARAIWNPKLDADAEIGDYVKTRYGKAAEPVLAYLNLVEAIVPHAVGIPGTDLQLDKQKQLISRFAEARKHLERARQLGKDTPGELLVDKLEASRQYAENEMRIRLAFLQNSSSGRSYAGLEELLAARRHLLEENRSTGVILSRARLTGATRSAG
jgi:hypothetical protein